MHTTDKARLYQFHGVNCSAYLNNRSVVTLSIYLCAGSPRIVYVNMTIGFLFLKLSAGFLIVFIEITH